MKYKGFIIHAARSGSAWRVTVHWHGKQMYDGYDGTKAAAVKTAKAHIRAIMGTV